MRKRMRVMHGLSEVAGQNRYSVIGLRENGVDAQGVVWDKHVFNYPYDISLHIDKSKRYLLPFYALKLFFFFIYALCRYNTFHFHYGRSILNNLELWVYDLFGKKYFYEFHGSDLRDYEEFFKKSEMPFCQDYITSDKQRKRNKKICASAKQIILHDDELIPYLPVEHAPVQIVPLRVDITNFMPVFPEENPKTIRIIHAPSKRATKGTEHVIAAVENLSRRYDGLELVLVEGKTQEEAREIYSTADIIVDQLYMGTYGVFAVEAMASGKPVITYISDEMKERLPEELPIISASINSIESTLEDLILNGKKRHEIGEQGRKYVEQYHDYRKIAKILIGIYSGELEPAIGREAFDRVKK